MPNKKYKSPCLKYQSHDKIMNNTQMKFEAKIRMQRCKQNTKTAIILRAQNF